MAFYTNFFLDNGYLLVREIGDTGACIPRRIKCRPTLYVDDDGGEFLTHTGKRVSARNFTSPSQARRFIEEYGKIDNFGVYGSTAYSYAMINELYPGEIDFNSSYIDVAYIDIEVAMKGAKPDPSTANQEIVSIALKHRGRVKVYSCLEYTVRPEDSLTYVKCDSETEVLERFLADWVYDTPNAVTGWYIDFFDIPYLVNRIVRVLGEDRAKSLSPWNRVEARNVTLFGREQVTFNIAGVSVLDYMRAYQKFTYVTRETYRLDYICDVEKVGRKIDYSEFGTLDTLYEKDPQKFIDYNVMDILLVEKLDEKLKLLELIFTISYLTKVNYEDTFGTVKLWETLIHNHLMGNGVVVPLRTSHVKRPFEGGYVKQPLIGKHEWVVSFDFDSLYPHIIMALNISNETIAGRISKNLSVDDMLNGRLDEVRGEIGDCACAASGVLFSRERQGFFPAIMNGLYAKRGEYKSKLKTAKRVRESAPKEGKQAAEREVARLDAIQKAIKYILNGGYGAMSNEYFLWFAMDLAESITLSGQLAVRYTADKLNEYVNEICKTEGEDYIVAVDTDSAYVDFSRLVGMVMPPGSDKGDIVGFLDEAVRARIGKRIDSIAAEWADYVNAYDRGKLHMKRENIADVGLWVAKKKYVMRVLDAEGVRLSEPDVKATGLELVKSSTPSVCRDALEKAMKIILDGDETALHAHVAKFAAEFNQMRFEDVAFPRRVNDVDKYTGPNFTPVKATPGHVKAAIAYNRALAERGLDSKLSPIADGDKIKFCYMNDSFEYGEVIACVDFMPEEICTSRNIDYATQFKKSFLDPLHLVIDVIGWNHEKKNSLSEFGWEEAVASQEKAETFVSVEEKKRAVHLTIVALEFMVDQ